jgi:CTP synthase (UTP-ammonia lyase)
MRECISIALVGDRGTGHRPEAALEALEHCSSSLGVQIRCEWFETPESACAAGMARLGEFDGVWIVPGSPYKSLGGVLAVIRFAREERRPMLGTCAGFQHLILEHARNVLGKADAVHAEYEPDAAEQAISRLSCSLVGRRQRVMLDPNSMVGKAYGRNWTEEEFRCNYGLNRAYVAALQATDLRIVGWDGA